MKPMLGIALLLQVLPAPDSLRWEEVSTDQAGRNAIDPASISRNGDMVRFRLRVIYANPAASRGVALSISEIVIDCQRERFGFRAADGYDEAGRLRYSRAIDLSEVVYQPLASLERHELIRVRVCGERLT